MDEKPRRYRLEYLPLFWDDLNEAVSYIADVLKAPEAAERLIDATEAGILAHSRNPTLATTYKTALPRPLPYYWFEVGNYMGVSTSPDDVMEVRRFLYGARFDENASVRHGCRFRASSSSAEKSAEKHGFAHKSVFFGR